MPELPVHVLGWDHHHTALARRERLSLAYGELPDCLNRLNNCEGVEEAVIVSTCNRSEFFVAGDIARSDLLQFVAGYTGLHAEELDEEAYHYSGKACIRHLFRVVSSLESMVIGEYQIVHQVRQAYECAQQCRSVGPVLHAAFQRALKVGKDVRSETAIGRYKVSIASVAVDLAQQIIGSLEQSRLLVIGAGEMADLALTHLVEKGVRSISVINRRQERAEQIIRDHGALRSHGIDPLVLEWGALTEALQGHDIVIASTAAPVPIITVEKLRHVHRHQPIMFIDLAVPRDIAEDVAELDNVYAYNLDHFDQVVARHQQLRQEDCHEAEIMIDAAAADYSRQRQQSDLLEQIASYFDELTETELGYARKHLRKNGVEPADDDLRYVLSRVSKKMRHQLLQLLREMPENHQLRELIGRICGRAD